MLLSNLLKIATALIISWEGPDKHTVFPDLKISAAVNDNSELLWCSMATYFCVCSLPNKFSFVYKTWQLQISHLHQHLFYPNKVYFVAVVLELLHNYNYCTSYYKIALSLLQNALVIVINSITSSPIRLFIAHTEVVWGLRPKLK